MWYYLIFSVIKCDCIFMFFSTFLSFQWFYIGFPFQTMESRRTTLQVLLCTIATGRKEKEKEREILFHPLGGNPTPTLPRMQHPHLSLIRPPSLLFLWHSKVKKKEERNMLLRMKLSWSPEIMYLYFLLFRNKRDTIYLSVHPSYITFHAYFLSVFCMHLSCSW